MVAIELLTLVHDLGQALDRRLDEDAFRLRRHQLVLDVELADSEDPTAIDAVRSASQGEGRVEGTRVEVADGECSVKAPNPLSMLAIDRN